MPRDDAFQRAGDVLNRHTLGPAAGGLDRGLVDEVREFRAGEARGEAGDASTSRARLGLHLAQVDAQDRGAAGLVGAVHHHLPVEAAGAHQRGVEDLGAVGGGEKHDPLARVEAVELGEKLVERLLLLVVAAAEIADAAPLAQRVELVDEDDAGGGLARLLEQIAHPRGADAHEHLDEFRAGDREEGHARLAGDGAGEEGLAGARRAGQQDALGDARAEAAELLGLASGNRRSPSAPPWPRRRRRRRRR
jgi:hypothetical protein